MNDNSAKFTGYGTGIVSAVIMGSMGIFVRNIEADGQTITFARLGLGLLFLITWLTMSGTLRSLVQTRISIYLPLSGSMMAANVLCYINAIGTTSLANAAFMLYLAPLIAVGLAALFLKERFTPAKGVLLLVAFLGFALLTNFDMSANLGDLEGYLWGLGAATGYALFIVFNRKIPAEIPPLARSFYQFFFGAVLIVPFLTVSVLVRLQPSDIQWLIGVGLVQGFLALSLLVVAIRHLEAVEYGTISYLEPLTAAAIGFVIYAERLTPLQVLGCSIILLSGVSLLILSQRRRVAA